MPLYCLKKTLQTLCAKGFCASCGTEARLRHVLCSRVHRHRNFIPLRPSDAKERTRFCTFFRRTPGVVYALLAATQFVKSEGGMLLIVQP